MTGASSRVFAFAQQELKVFNEKVVYRSNELFKKFIVNVLVDKASRSSTTDLTIVEEDPVETMRYRIIEISVRKDDMRGLSTGLDRHLLHVRLCRGDHDLLLLCG